ncbi:hypothetical protein BH20ACT15_BH20ACT15_01210 [soil metagenome]
MDVRLESEPEAPRQARAAIAPLAEQVSERTLHDLRVVVSELVSNAVVHAPGEPIHVQVDVDTEGVIHGEISDRGDGDVKLRPTAPGRPGGHGLGIVDALTDRWGVRDGSARVWFELAGSSSAH